MKFLFALLLFPLTLFSQEPALDAAARKTVVTTVSQLLLDNYVFPDTAVLMSKRLQKQLKTGAYDKITDPVVFSDALTKDLYAVYHDAHLLVQYAPQTAADNAAPAPEAEEDPFRRLRRANFGLTKVEILNGNIGYLNIDRFWADTLYGKATVKAALQFVSNTRALIIDVRNNGGGSQETVSLICGYFLEKPTHLNDMYSRPSDRTTNYYTTPDSTLPSLASMPLYILTSGKTFSAAEEFSYDLQQLGRATIIGETTGGGAHGTFSRDAGNGFIVYIPYSRAINPISKTNWEGTGVLPDIPVSAEKALETAELRIFGSLITGTNDPEELYQLNWDLALLQAINNPIVLDIETLRQFSGVYGERTFTLENGKLYYQRAGRPKFELEALSANVMKGKGNTYFKIEFVQNASGETEKVVVYYQDNRVESSERSR